MKLAVPTFFLKTALNEVFIVFSIPKSTVHRVERTGVAFGSKKVAIGWGKEIPGDIQATNCMNRLLGATPVRMPWAAGFSARLRVATDLYPMAEGVISAQASKSRRE